MDKLIEISNHYGSNPDYVLAGGGNTSMKNDRYLYIKGSGTTLADIKQNGFVKMDRSALDVIWKKTYSDDSAKRESEVLESMLDARAKGEESKRPSVETLLHDLIPFKYVVHLHPALVNGLTCSNGGENLAKEIFGDTFVWIPITDPGYVLALEVKKAVDIYLEQHSYKMPEFILLQNHGIFVYEDDIEKIKETYTKIMDTLKARVEKDLDFSEVEFDKERAAMLAPAIRMLLKKDSSSIVKFYTNTDVMKLIESKPAFEAISGSYTPDHIVYCKANALFVEKSADLGTQYEFVQRSIEEYEKEFGYLPKIVAVEGLGIYAHGTSKKNADMCAAVFLDAVKIAVYTQFFGGYSFMPQKNIDFIVNWEAESYRSNVSTSNGNAKRMSEKIAIVTGSAQGFGDGIALELIKEGANIIIADLNYDLAMANAQEYCENFGAGKAFAVRLNAAEPESVNQMFIETALEFGGIDLYVNNAGVLKAGGLEDMDPQSFDFVTKVNYNGYFYGAKYAARFMKIQNGYSKDYFMDIVQINSKSGLSGSNKNFAYAGSKFGGIGLTQSFALELVEYNIKVNSVCPGNFYDGPLWSDPERGLFVQYLKAGKVPGAKSIDDVRKFYEAKSPIRRGCFPADVARAIFYCVEQQFETGQAIPVTGGQNMLK